MMFDTPAYASYIALCHELQLEREPAYGDVFVDTVGAILVNIGDQGEGGWLHEPGPLGELRQCNGGDAWLPRLDQWLAMLEEAGWAEVKFSPDAQLLDGSPVLWRINGFGWDARWSVNTWLEFTELHTREEAAARLWMAVDYPQLPSALEGEIRDVLGALDRRVRT